MNHKHKNHKPTTANRKLYIFQKLSSWKGTLLPLLGLVALLYPTLTLPLSRGEAMYAQIPLEMLNSGNFLTPTLNGVPYLEKPPLLYWLNLVAMKICGPYDWAARLPTMTLTLLEIWLTWRLGGLLLPPTAAWWGGFILLTSIGFFYLHTQLFTDHLITLSLMTALYALLRWLSAPRCPWLALFHAALGAGYLSKGLIGVGFPALITLIFSYLGPHAKLRRLLFHPGGLALLSLIILPWLSAMTWVHPGFLQHHFITEHFVRLAGARQPGGVSTLSAPMFWLFLALWLLPWTFLLPTALLRFCREAVSPAQDQMALLLIWPGVVLGLFTLSGTRIEYYSLPALPPLALILGWVTHRGLEARRWQGLTLALLVLALMSLLTPFSPTLLEKLCTGNRREFVGLFAELPPLAWQVGLIIPPLAFLGVFLARRSPAQGLTTFAAIALILLYFTCQALLLLAPIRSDKIFGDWLRSHTRPADLVIMESLEEFELAAGLTFYARRPVLLVQRHGLPRFLYPVPPEKNYLISPDKLAALWHSHHRVFLLVDDCGPKAEFLDQGKLVLSSGGKKLWVNRD